MNQNTYLEKTIFIHAYESDERVKEVFIDSPDEIWEVEMHMNEERDKSLDRSAIAIATP